MTKKEIKKTVITTMLITFACVITIISIYLFFPSGKCGEDAQWNYNSITHTLTISGTGNMCNYYPGEHAPWSFFPTKINENIVYVEIESGITHIGTLAFADCTNLTKITIPKSVTSMGSQVFYNCPNITIYGYANSAAYKYAKDNIPFITIT